MRMCLVRVTVLLRCTIGILILFFLKRIGVNGPYSYNITGCTFNETAENQGFIPDSNGVMVCITILFSKPRNHYRVADLFL